MKKIALLGDSIRQIGYGPLVPALLPDCTVVQPEDNCRFSKYTLRGVIVEWAELIEGCDVIHWNNGLWDVSDDGEGVFTSPEEYVETMLRIARILKKHAKHVIFATTTPVRLTNLTQDNERIEQYNRLIVPVLLEHGIEINDLHELVRQDVQAYIRPDDKIHLTQIGAELCAKQVASAIRACL